MPFFRLKTINTNQNSTDSLLPDSALSIMEKEKIFLTQNSTRNPLARNPKIGINKYANTALIAKFNIDFMYYLRAAYSAVKTSAICNDT